MLCFEDMADDTGAVRFADGQEVHADVVKAFLRGGAEVCAMDDLAEHLDHGILAGQQEFGLE